MDNTIEQLAEQQQAENRVLDELAKMTQIEYERVRKDKAAALGVRPAILDAEIKDRRKRLLEGEQGMARRLVIEPPEPWHDPVDGASLIGELEETVLRYVVVEREAALAIALWILHTYLVDAAEFTPRLAIMSPEKRCGKTTLLSVIGALACKPMMVSNITTAALFRMIETSRPTLLIDEADTFIAKAEEMRGAMNSGHRKDGTFVRTVGDDYEPRPFATFSPLAIAMIGVVPETLLDRSIAIQMRRRTPQNRVERFRLDRGSGFVRQRRQAARLAGDIVDIVECADPRVPDELHDRAADNWRVLLAIADAVGGDLPEHARKAALVLGGLPVAEDQSLGALLLADLQSLFVEHTVVSRIASHQLCLWLSELDARPWCDLANGKPITPSRLARLLKPYGILPKAFRVDEIGFSGVFRGYFRSAFDDAFARYVPQQAATSQQGSLAAARDPGNVAGVAGVAPAGEGRSDAAGAGTASGADTRPEDAGQPPPANESGAPPPVEAASE